MNKWRTPEAPTGLMCGATPVPQPTTPAEALEVALALTEELHGLWYAARDVELTRFVSPAAVFSRLTAILQPVRALYDATPDGPAKGMLAMALVQLRGELKEFASRCGLSVGEP